DQRATGRDRVDVLGDRVGRVTVTLEEAAHGRADLRPGGGRARVVKAEVEALLVDARSLAEEGRPAIEHDRAVAELSQDLGRVAAIPAAADHRHRRAPLARLRARPDRMTELGAELLDRD